MDPTLKWPFTAAVYKNGYKHYYIVIRHYTKNTLPVDNYDTLLKKFGDKYGGNTPNGRGNTYIDKIVNAEDKELTIDFTQ